MKVFVSWSGETSKHVAETLHKTIRLVINGVDPWLSSESINAGARWRDELSMRLKATRFGIVCVTRANQHAPWLNFEAGALATAIDASRVVPIAIDLSPAEISGPMAEFQAQPLNQDGLRRLFISMNELLEPPLTISIIEAQLSVWGPKMQQDLRESLEGLKKNRDIATEQQVRSDRELLEEAVESMRKLSQRPVGTAGSADRITLAHLALERVRDVIPLHGTQEFKISDDFTYIELGVRPEDDAVKDWMKEHVRRIVGSYGLKFRIEEYPF